MLEEINFCPTRNFFSISNMLSQLKVSSIFLTGNAKFFGIPDSMFGNSFSITRIKIQRQKMIVLLLFFFFLTYTHIYIRERERNIILIN